MRDQHIKCPVCGIYDTPTHDSCDACFTSKTVFREILTHVSTMTTRNQVQLIRLLNDYSGIDGDKITHDVDVNGAWVPPLLHAPFGVQGKYAYAGGSVQHMVDMLRVIDKYSDIKYNRDNVLVIIGIMHVMEATGLIVYNNDESKPFRRVRLLHGITKRDVMVEKIISKYNFRITRDMSKILFSDSMSYTDSVDEALILIAHTEVSIT